MLSGLVSALLEVVTGSAGTKPHQVLIKTEGPDAPGRGV